MAVETSRWGIIYNPKAGSRKAQKKWNKIREYMEERGVLFDYLQSEGYGSVERLARMLANNGYRTIVIVGGDGAINDAVNGIMTSSAENKSDIALGIIPNGIGKLVHHGIIQITLVIHLQPLYLIDREFFIGRRSCARHHHIATDHHCHQKQHDQPTHYGKVYCLFHQFIRLSRLEFKRYFGIIHSLVYSTLFLRKKQEFYRPKL